MTLPAPWTKAFPNGVARARGRRLRRAAGRWRLGQVAGQVVAGQQRLQVVREQQALCAAARPVVVHDAALEALIDEVVVRSDRRLA